MYPNLRAEMSRKGYSVKDLSNLTGIKLGTLQKKMTGQSPMLVSEAFKISEALGGISIDYLFIPKGGE